MKKLILFGNTSFAKLLKYHIEFDSTFEIAAFTVDRDYLNQEMQISFF